MRIGLLGGSFNPAHEGHLHLARTALARLGLDQVWLMVSPGNPLKPVRGMAPLAERLGSAQRLADGRRIVATDIERHLRTRFAVDTLAALRRRFPRATFIWLMGADNLTQLPRWRRWMDLARGTAFAVMPRPTYNHRALAGQAARRLAKWRLPIGHAHGLGRRTSEARGASEAWGALKAGDALKAWGALEAGDAATAGDVLNVGGTAAAGMAAPAWVFLPARENAASATARRAAMAENRASVGETS
jgi:nicotinate-nucleotide adenylyltransferase